MSKKDKVTSTIDVLKVAMVSLLTALFGVFAWAIIHYKEIDLVQLVCGVVVILVIGVGLFVVAKALIKNLNKLEEL